MAKLKKKVEILKHSFDPSIKLMNSRLEIHSTCLHKPEFHRFSADESHKDEKVTLEESVMPNHWLALINRNICACNLNPNYFNGIVCQPMAN